MTYRILAGSWELSFSQSDTRLHALMQRNFNLQQAFSHKPDIVQSQVVFMKIPFTSEYFEFVAERVENRRNRDF